jgi:hypothetical protein
MSVESRWFRLDVDWFLEPWLLPLDHSVKSVWPFVLGHVKSYGNNRGKCRAIPIEMFARMYGIPTDDAANFFSAAFSSEAITEEDGHWVLTVWDDHQNPETLKKRAQRQQPSDEQKNVRDKQEMSGTSGDCPGPSGTVPSTRQDKTREEKTVQDKTVDISDEIKTRERLGKNLPAKKDAQGMVIYDIPPKLANYPGFPEAWVEWEKYRSAKKKPLSKFSIPDQLKLLMEQPDPVACIRQSIRCDWTGLFAIKGVGANGDSNLGSKSQRMLEEAGYGN